MKQPRKTSFLRNTSILALLASGVVFFTGCKKDTSEVQAPESTTLTEEQSVSASAVSTYEGFGAQAIGGSNSSTVYHVTNLNASGSGSLAGGIGSNKTIVFDVSGTITGRFDLANISYLTIDATGQDITINNNNSGDGFSFDGPNTHHCILKGVHVTNAGNDGINVVDGAHDILITNCTSYNNGDGNIDVAADNSGQTKNVTVQYCILGDNHGSGKMLVTGQNVSVHHNLYVGTGSGEGSERNPFVHANYSPVGSPNIDFRNNVVYNWGRYGSGIGYKATGNFVNNFYASNKAGAIDPNADPSGNTASYYVAGNLQVGGANINLNGGNHALYAIPAAAAVVTQDACSAGSTVLNNAGPSPRNSTDLSLINKVTLSGCSGGTTNQNPTANAGADQTITLPTSSVTLSGSGSDPDGTIASYAWSKVSGTGGTITSVSAASTTVTGLTAGSYTFKLTVTDDKGATASDNVTIVVNSVPVNNVPPTVSAGAGQTITLPVNAATLSGTASDPDGSIASYAWSKVSGTGGTITSPSSASTTVTGLTQGSYTFKLTVTDNKGATASANVSVTVNPATQTGTGYTLSYTEGYDVSSSVNTNQGIRNVWSTSGYKTGPGSFKSEVRAGDASLSGGFRSEMLYTGTSQNPTEGAIEYDVYYQGWSNLDGGGTNISWNPATSGAGAIVSLQNYGGKFDVVRAIGSSVTHQSGTLMNVTANTWYKMRWEYKWSTGTDGYVRLYINDALYYSFTGKTADGSGQTLRVGQNRWPNSGSTMTTTSICYYDNMKIYSK